MRELFKPLIILKYLLVYLSIVFIFGCKTINQNSGLFKGKPDRNENIKPLFIGNWAGQKPNMVVFLSDDQSWPHAIAYECKFVNTPAFDRIASEEVLFHNAFAPA